MIFATALPPLTQKHFFAAHHAAKQLLEMKLGVIEGCFHEIKVGLKNF